MIKENNEENKSMQRDLKKARIIKCFLFFLFINVIINIRIRGIIMKKSNDVKRLEEITKVILKMI